MAPRTLTPTRVSQIAAAPVTSNPESAAGATAPATVTASWLRAKYRPRTSENYASPATLLAMGNWFSDKYAEGTVGRRFY
ncbi:glycine hydroxymethyltransferase, partial [Streptomyces sp. NPDC005349]